MPPIPPQKITIPFAVSLAGKWDQYALQAPGVAVLKNAEFDELGGIQTRKPYAPILNDSANTIADIRRIYEAGDELLAFSKDALWSYSSGDGEWTQRATHLAVDVDEAPRFVRTGQQYNCDRAELGGVTMYCWEEETPSGVVSYVAAIDSATGAVKLAPASIETGAIRPKLLATTNRLVLLYIETSGSATIKAKAYDPADLSSPSSSGSINVNATSTYDAIVRPDTGTSVLVAVSAATAWALLTVTEAGAISTTRSRTVTCDEEGIAIAWDSADDDRILICYANGTSIRGDFLNSDGTDYLTDEVIGTASSATVNQIACAFDGTDTFEVFWSAGEATDSTEFAIEWNTVDDAGANGTEAELVVQCGLASRAFRHDGYSYVWAVFSAASQGDITAQLQNTYLLIRADGHIAAKCCGLQAGGFSADTGYLPNVANTSGNVHAWCAQIRGIVNTADGLDQKAYAAKSPQDVVFEFDSDEARRVVKLGRTVYTSGGIVRQYDGRGLYEVGFHSFPFDISITPGGGGSNLNGNYSWMQTYAWANAAGEVEESTTTTTYEVNVPSANSAQVIGVNLTVTAKQDSANPVEVRWYRQEDAAAEGAYYYQVSSLDPAAASPNDFVENDPTAILSTQIVDDYADATLTTKRPMYELGGVVLQNLPPPSARIVTATQDRLIFAGIAGHPSRIAYSKLRGDGEVAAANPALYIDLPPTGGKVTAVGFLNETMAVFKESAIYMLPGDGYANDRSGQNYGPARIVSSDVGAESMEAVALTPLGLIHKSSKGWYLLGQSWAPEYIGGPVSDFDSETVVAVHVMESQHQVRIVTDSRILVWDYLSNVRQGQRGAWSEWTTPQSIAPVGSCMFNGVHHITGGATIYEQISDWATGGLAIWNGPKTTTTGASSGASTIATGDTSLDGVWPSSGGIVIDRGNANEEWHHYSALSAAGVFALESVAVPGNSATLANTHAAGVTIEFTPTDALYNSLQPLASNRFISLERGINVSPIEKFPFAGEMIIDAGGADEEIISYEGRSYYPSTPEYEYDETDWVVNSHSSGETVAQLMPEAQGLDIETGWLALDGIQGFKNLRRAYFLGRLLGGCRVRIRVAYDYEESSGDITWSDDKTWSPDAQQIGVMQFEHCLSRPYCQSVKFRLTVLGEYVDGTLAPSTAGISLTALTLLVGMKQTPYPRLPVAQRQ